MHAATTFADLPSYDGQFSSLEEAEGILLGLVLQAGCGPVYRYHLTQNPDLPVIKLVVANCEFFESINKRVGYRLKDFVGSISQDDVQSHLK